MKIANLVQKQRVLTGIRPTGPLHLGHYVGALKQWLDMQDKYECFFLIADVQAMTTHADNPSLIQTSVRQVVMDWLAVGLNPHKRNVHFVLQSQIPELNVLYTLLSMITPFSWVERNPTIKSEKQFISDATLGFMDYPVSQAADILVVSFDPKVNDSKILVPVGQDQLPHLEATNDIARRFNRTYVPTFSECSGLVGEIGRLVGIDGSEKMSKSLGNCIYLSDTSQVVQRSVKRMFTDPTRLKATDPGHVEGNPVFIYHDAFNPNIAEVEDLKRRYLKGTVGDVEVKDRLIIALEAFLEPIRDRRERAAREDIGEILRSGTHKARQLGKATLERALAATQLNYSDLHIRR